MDFNLIVLVILLIVTVIVLKSIFIKKNNVVLSNPLPLPNSSSEMRQYTQRFNAEWPSDLEARISKSIVKEFPHLSTKELPNLWYELKTYLYLASLVKTLPMFSKEIDLVWHEMLEHEKEYNAFCKRFCGHVIEHHPHDTPKHLPKERAFFNILYRGMFPSSESNHYWGSFVSEEEQMIQWINRIENDSDAVYEETYNKNNSSLSNKVYLSFLKSNQKEIQYSRSLIADRKQNEYTQSASVYSNDLVWLYSLGAISGTFYEENPNELKNNYSSDSAMVNTVGFTFSDKKSEDNYIDSDSKVSTHSSFDTNENNSNDSHSSSSCSSSSCSSCSSCSS